MLPPFRVWLVATGEPLPLGPASRAMRCSRLAHHLARRGHHVTWWTSGFDHFRKRHNFKTDTTIVSEGATIQVLASPGYSRNVSLRRMLDHMAVARRFRARVAVEEPPDIILAAFPTIELAREAVRFGVEHNIPVLVDVQDLWPDVLINVVPPSLRWASRTALRPLITDTVFTLQQCAGIIGISDGYLEWALRRAARERRGEDTVIPLGSSVMCATSEEGGDATHLRSLGVDPTKTIFWYLGSFGRTYDLVPVLDAARMLLLQGRHDIQFVISGDGDRSEAWRAHAAGAANVVFTGWVEAPEVSWLAAHAAVGLQPYAAKAPQGLANKLFEYLSVGVPVISSLPGENAQLLMEHSCGLTYRPGDAHDCLQQILRLADDPALRVAMGRRARALFDERFDSDVVVGALAAHVEAVAQRHHSRDGLCQRRIS